MARVWPIGPTTNQKHVLKENVRSKKKIKMSPIIDCLSSECIRLKIVSAGPLAVVNWLQIHVLKSFIWKNVNCMYVCIIIISSLNQPYGDAWE